MGISGGKEKGFRRLRFGARGVLYQKGYAVCREFEKINFLTIRGSNRYAATIKTIVYMHMKLGFARIAVFRT